ncbi:hypothetical protein BOTBODRAFT_36195 [Botryobasidium botryosum FD-172 SS1]|uniref:Aminopeptidase P N-terminal domain-containing protein n=1 Tax=Botryobasidium botryosum (strain FD-172 SS1) TaxID=930990 RepID=A0A067MFZ8_BOTB1|nr:hypothetical protein BOTBODRAFT_36195 [Botryobasidium botryosum FD-172 SS1]
MGAPATGIVHTTERVNALRELMKRPEHNVHAYVVVTEDQHASEYLADCDARRAFISGFNGSAGCAIVTLQEAFIFVDGRYYLQAEKQIDQNWTLMKQGLPNVPTWQEYLSKHLEKDSRIGIDPTLISALDAKDLRESLKGRKSELVPIDENLVDQVWGSDRPARPQNKIFPLDVKYAGKTSKEKLTELRAKLVKEEAGAMIVNMLDEVAWLFNLRGSDIAFNPVFFAYALVTHSKAVLYVNDAQIGDDVRAHLGEDVEIHPYNEVFNHLKSFYAEEDKGKKVLVGKQTSLALANAIGLDNLIIKGSPIAELKAQKNDTETEGFRQAHIRDGVALVRYFAWLEERLNTGPELNESQGADKLEEFRSQGDLFMGLSFTTISSAGPNGAIIHYSPNPKDCAIIKKDQMYLCDSGAQYWDGTTDVTRTWHFGTPTAEEIRAFTRVLQGHIAIDTAIFPQGTSGYLLDAFARRPLWQEGLDYRHGTGHGVGHFLNVHEGPQGIGTRLAYNSTPLKKGMTLSNEPGYYADGRFGIRIESVCIVTEASTPNNFGDRGYLGFENFTMCPIHTKLVDVSLLTPDERSWLNSYHETVLAKLKPLLEKTGDQKAVSWLEQQCAAV